MREVVAVVEKYSFKLIDRVVEIKINPSFIDDLLCSESLPFLFGSSLSFGAEIDDLKVEISEVLFSDCVLCFEETSSIEYYFFFAKSDEKTNLLQFYRSVS